MREIKFRAWRKTAKEIMEWKHLKYWEIELGEDNDHILMQYTGLKDKNGKEIYEGDVVRILYSDWASKLSSDTRSLDEYKKSISFVGVVEYFVDGFELTCGRLMEGRHGEKEVIGNKYENPELINPPAPECFEAMKNKIINN